MDKSRLDKQFDFCREIDKEKFIGRQTYLSDAVRKENDAEHAWHAALMTILLSEYASEKIDVLKTVTMLLIHDIVEIDAGDTYAYDDEALKTQHDREQKAADRIFGLLPDDQALKLRSLWEEFEKGDTPESKFAHAMDNIQPVMLNALTNGKAWKEHEVVLSKILKRNEQTAKTSNELWNYAFENLISPNIEKGNIVDDTPKTNDTQKSNSNKKFYTYMLRCEDNSIYTGITTDIDRRMKEHFSQGEKSAKYTRTHTPKKLEAVWQSNTRVLASKLEYRIKQLTKEQKETLIANDSLDVFGEKVETVEYERADIKSI